MSVQIQKQTKLPAHKWRVSCVEFSPDGFFLASGSWDKKAIVWDLRTLESSQVINHHRQPVTCVSFQPKFSSNGLLATGSADHTVALWNPFTGTLVQSFNNHSSWVLSTCFSPDGKLLASASRDKMIGIVDVETGKIVTSLTGHTTGVWACSFNPDESSSNSDTLCSGSEDGGLKIWDMRSHSVVMSLVGGHEDCVKCCSWSPRGNYVASTSADGKLTLWEPRSGTALTKIKACDDSANAVKFYPVIEDSTIPLLFSVGSHTCNVWHPFRKQSKQLLSYKVNESGEEIQTLSISPDGTLLATSGSEKEVVLSSINISLDEIDALPIDTGEKNMNRGTLLWKKYTRKVIEKSNNEQVAKNTSVTDQSHNSALLVGLAVHKNEEEVKKYVERAGTLHYNATEKLHAEPEVILQHHKQKLRHRNGSGGLHDLQNQEEHIKKSPPSSPIAPNQLEEIRQQLRKVSRTSSGSTNRIENAEPESAISKVNGWNTVMLQNGDHRNGYPLARNGGDKGVVVSVDTDSDNDSRQRNGRPPHHTNGYDSHVYSAVRDHRVNIQPSSRYQPFSIPNERDRMSNGNDDQESISASSSSYYADIDDVAQEMLELTRKVEDHRL